MIPDDRPPRDLIVTIPGISVNLADVIIAETGADMSRFPSARHLASCAGTCSGSNESAGRSDELLSWHELGNRDGSSWGQAS